MKKVLIASVTALAIAMSAGTTMAGPFHGHDQLGFAQDVRSAVSQARNHAGTKNVGDRGFSTNSDERQYETDFPVGEVADGQLFGGLEIGINHLSSGVSSRIASADISADGYDATLSALWVADNQFYIDGQLRFGNFDGSIGLNGRNTVDVDGNGYELSVEIGKSFGMPNEWTLIPQVQAMYSDINMENVPDRGGIGQIGSLVDGDTLMARVGLRAEHTFANNSMLYGQIDVYHAFDNEASVMVGQNTVSIEPGQNTTALTIGGDIPLSDHALLYAEISSETDLGNSSGDQDFSWNIGFEVQF